MQVHIMHTEHQPRQAVSSGSFQTPQATISGYLARQRSNRVIRAFTVVEVLIAITVSLLLMLSLTRAFKYLADQIRENRVQVEISNDLRTVNQLISDDLKKMTVSMRPMDAQSLEQGYFVYYEGPCTDTTSVMLGQPGIVLDNEGAYFGESRYGDIDDYIAFTAYSPEIPFRGIVPRYIVDFRNLDVAGTPLPDYTTISPFEPTVIYSNYAEIAYWLQPEYVTSVDPNSGRLVYQYNPDLGHPAIINDENNRFPRKLVLHRRVLLIRPDLNRNDGLLPQQMFGSGANSYVFMQYDPSLPRAWQIGMTPIHQQSDLSVRLALDTNGLPTNRIAANSLADLNQPHNRFAHIRVPSSVIGDSSNSFSTMPVLAVGSELSYLTDAISTNASTASYYPSLQSNTPNLSSFNGLLRPEFSLGMDLTHAEVPTDWWGTERLGEDVLASSVVGFDLQGFDPSAISAIHFGKDGVAGTDGLPNQRAGEAYSDDYAFDSNSPLFFEAIRPNGTPLPPIETRGTFVDLAYDRLAGGVVRDMDAQLKAFISSPALSPSIAPLVRKQYLTSALSLTRQDFVNPAITLPTDSILRSGKLLRRPNGSVIFFQPTYDTYTNHYESDGFAQGDLRQLSGASLIQGTVWFNPSLSQSIDTATDGIDSVTSLPGVDDISERETLPPFDVELSELRIRLRLFDESSGAIAQQAVIKSIDD